MTPDIFALQLASPLPPTPVAATPTGAPAPAAAVPAEGEATTRRDPRVPFAPPAQRHRPDAAGTPRRRRPKRRAGRQRGYARRHSAAVPGRPATEAQTDLPQDRAPDRAADGGRRSAAARHGRCGTPNAGGEQPSQTRSSSQPASGPERRCAGEQARRRAGPGRHDAAGSPRPPPVAQPVATPAPTALQRAIPLYQAPERRPADPDRGRSRHHAREAQPQAGRARWHRSAPAVDAARRHRPARGRFGRSGEAADAGGRRPAPRPRGPQREPALAGRLDASSSTRSSSRPAPSRPTSSATTTPGRRANLRVGPQGDAGLTETAAPADTSLVLPNGVHVDVLA